MHATTTSELIGMTGFQNVLGCLCSQLLPSSPTPHPPSPSSHRERHTHTRVCMQGSCTCASDNQRKVIGSSFVLHASCLKTFTEGSDTLNVDDLYSITLQRRSATDGSCTWLSPEEDDGVEVQTDAERPLAVIFQQWPILMLNVTLQNLRTITFSVGLIRSCMYL